MIFLFLILGSFGLFVSSQSDRKIQTCLLPFVTKPCINDGQNLSCTFNLNSSERRKTCDLSSVSLIFTTSHVELFVIPEYYNQVILADEHVINKLIIEPDIPNRTFTYFPWSSIPIISIEIPINIPKFEIMHETHNLQITRTLNHMNNPYWHLKMWPVKRSSCRLTTISIYNITTRHYPCPNYQTYQNYKVCGYTYVCLGGEPCYFTGYRQLVCPISIFRSWMQFEVRNDDSQYETIFITLLDSNLYAIHHINQDTFIIDRNSTKPIFITKRAVFIISTGILQISAKLFDSSDDDFQVRIEHAQCSEKRFILDILDDDKDSINDHLFDYTTAMNGGIGCHLNTTDTTIIERFQPHIELTTDTLVHAGRENDIFFILNGLPPFNITWFRNNILVETSEFVMTNAAENFFMSSFMIELAIGNTKKTDNGVEYRVNVTNRLGQCSATTRLNVTYKPTFITSLQNRTIKQGSNITLEVKIDGNPTPDVYIQWLNFKERLYPTDNDQLLYQYNLQNVQSNQSTSYTFSATSESYEKTISQTAFLSVFDLLYVINPTHTINVEEGSCLNLTVQFSHSIIKTQWFVNNISIENTSISYAHHTEDNQTSLIINNISLSHNGQYKVQVWDDLNQTNQSLTIIHIYSLPPLIMNCYNEIIQKKLWVCLICRFQAKNPQIQWIDPKGQVIINQSNYDPINETAHIFDAKLVFKKIMYEHFGIYTLQVNNSGGSIIHKTNFTIKDMSPIIGYHTFSLGKMYMHQGDSYSFILYFTGISWPNVTFFYNNKILLSYSDPDVSPVSVSLKNLSINDEGIYYARVMNSEGYAETNRTELCILQAPSFITRNQQLSSMISVKHNQTITLITPKIKAGSPDPLKIIWFVKEQTFKQLFNSSMSDAKLTINASLQQEQIACVIENKNGASGYFFKLNFLQAPDFVLTLTKQIYVELGQNVILTVNVTGNPLPTIQWFYNKHIIHNKRFEYYVSIGSGRYSLIIDEFALEDVGNYSVVASNSENQVSSETQIILKSTTFRINDMSSTRTVTLLTAARSTMKSIPTCGDNITRIIISVLMIGLIIMLLIPVFCKQKRLLAFFGCRKENIDSNDLIKNHHEINRNVPSPQSNTSYTE